MGVPPLVPGDGGGGGTLTGGGERSGKRGGDSGEGLPCRLEGRVEDWKPPAIADLRSSYRWADEHKVTKMPAAVLQAGVGLLLRLSVFVAETTCPFGLDRKRKKMFTTSRQQAT